jgi:DNA helicase-2/ATP-dependent DNA helicase PcrA
VQVSRPVYSPQSRPTLQQATRPAGSNLSMSGRRFQDETPPGAFKLGQRVRHAKFGDGVVLSLEGQGANARVQVNFERQGTKWLMLGYANLESL